MALSRKFPGAEFHGGVEGMSDEIRWTNVLPAISEKKGTLSARSHLRRFKYYFVSTRDPSDRKGNDLERLPTLGQPLS